MKLTVDDIEFEIDMVNNTTAKELEKILPQKFLSTKWGGELYGEVSKNITMNGKYVDVCDVGDCVMWQGRTFCIFFGSTPASIDGRPTPVSPVIVVGKIRGDCSELKKVGPNSVIILEA